MEHQEITKSSQRDHHKDTQCRAKPALAKPTPGFPIQQLQRAIGNSAVGRLMQAKLSISEPGGLYEQEADRVADIY